MKRSTYALATAAVGIATIAAVPTADAAFTTVCVGEGAAVTVPGDLRVPAGETCWLKGTTVEGDVKVAPGANFIAESATIGGQVIARDDAWVDLDDSAVDGQVRLVNAYGYYGVGARLGDGAVVNRNDETLPPGLFLSYDSSIAGNLTARDGEVALEGTMVDGQVVGRGALYVDVIDSVVTGRLRVIDTAEGSIVCDSEIYGNGVFDGNADVLQLGGSGTYGDCESSTYWDGNLTVRDNAAAVSLHDNIVRGDLGGNGNDPAPTGDANRVRGNTWGQFRDLAPAAETQAASEPGTTTKALEQAADPMDRTGELERAADERREAAITQAVEAGPADL